MSKLYIRNRSCSYITFIRTKEDFQTFVDYYVPGRHLTIGDISTFNKSMRNMLLKFIEENPEVDCFSSEDVVDSVIQSRFVQIIKDPLEYSQEQSYEKFQDSDKTYLSTLMYLSGLSSQAKLRAPLCKKQLFKLL